MVYQMEFVEKSTGHKVRVTVTGKWNDTNKNAADDIENTMNSNFNLSDYEEVEREN